VISLSCGLLLVPARADPGSVEALVKQLDVEAERVAAIKALAALKAEALPALPPLLALLHSSASKRELCQELVKALVALGPGALPGICQDLEKGQSVAWLALVCEQYGKAAESALPALAKALEQATPRDRTALVRALAAPRSKTALPALERALLLKVNGTGEALGHLGEVALPVLQQTLKQEDAALRNQAIAGLRLLGPAAIPALSGALSDDKTAQAAAFALEELGMQARPAIPALEKVLAERAHSYAADALAKMEALDALVRVLQGPNLEARGYAAAALGAMAGKAQAAIPALEAARRKADSTLREDIDMALEIIRAAKTVETPKH